ncbi:alpha/beta hydrolase [uncultured Oceanicoccus sp.]|uniref:alpha/beta fold hydrolase n=1 Tax=uncultured Oceanicoccus sp. TaxID=1706381 RepID=UPI0030DBFF25
MSAIERKFFVNGYQLAAKEWNAGAEIKVIASHGWLDNAASFDILAPLLKHCHIMALDLSGHGLSDHKSPQASYNIWDDLLDILAIADELSWETFSLLGHSRGAMISILLAASMPQRINKLLMLDAILPLPISVADTAQQLNQFLVQRRQLPDKKPPSYSTIDEAVQARCKAIDICPAMAHLIVERGLMVKEGRYFWTTDSRLTTTSAFKMTAEHNQAIFKAVAIPCLLLIAEDGLGTKKQYKKFPEQFTTLNYQTLPGRHHFHMEEQAAEIAVIAEQFFLGLD